MAEAKVMAHVGPGPSWLRRILGEMSALRTLGLSAFGFFSPYRLDSSRVDYELARALYRNTDDRYKLGAGFARPIINTTAGFMGVPSFAHENADAHAALETVMGKWTGKLLRINRNALRDGDVFARLTYQADRFNPDRKVFDLRLVPPEWVTPVLDPITGGWQRLVIRYPVQTKDENGRNTQDYTVVETLTATDRIVEVDNRAPADVRAALNTREPNPWGFIPIVHFRNEAEETALYGVSDLEAVEPFLKAYHDVMLFAVQGSKLFSRPKVKFQLKDVKKFLEDNFTPDEIRSGKLRFMDKEIFFLKEGDDASFVTADSGLEGITTLLKFLYFCIVDVSETPEFAFGTAVASSKASVSEQMVPLERKIRRKRGQFEEYYGELASMFLAMWARVENVSLDSYEVTITWDEISPRNDTETATTIKTLVEGLTLAMESGLVSIDAAAEFLRQYIPTMLPWDDAEAQEDESRRVQRTIARIQRLQDPAGFGDDDGDGEARQRERGAA